MKKLKPKPKQFCGSKAKAKASAYYTRKLNQWLAWYKAHKRRW